MTNNPQPENLDRRSPPLDPSQGNAVVHSLGQLTREDLRNMTPQQIMQAKAEGRCDDLLNR